jgi:hypothetical protein
MDLYQKNNEENKKNKEKEEKDNYIVLLNNLPEDLIFEIKKFIPLSISIWFQREDYIKNHKIVKSLIPRTQYENYIRDMIRKDCSFVFKLLLEENFYKWLNLKKYIYKYIVFDNYIYFLQNYCIENDSTNCRNVMQEFLKDTGLSKNQHKKNTIKNIKRWRI